MKLKYLQFLAFLFLVVVASCKNDDDEVGFVEADRGEQQIVDRDSLIYYLETHYYNSWAFETPGDYTISDIVISESPQDEDGNVNTRLIDVVETRTQTYLDTEYDYYILKLNHGGGESPHFTDNIFVNYSGMMQNHEVFDSTVNPVDFDLMGLIPGWSYVLPEFGTAESFVINGDGTLTYSNYGLGVMFLPSGLGYFGAPPPSIRIYSNLIFKFELYQFEVNDHDNDGIPSYIEDLNGNHDVFDDNTDGDTAPNFIDADDDGDGVLTINELEHITYVIDTNIGETLPVLAEGEYERSRSTNAGIITLKTVKIVDSNSNGIPDYLEASISIDYSN